ncbi:MAG TPA: tripartite tricarboxylate transporter substrate binding protein [Casimicrobiaceae bacterium]|nr:tripartite tricarboxylate transporter substrate binding protein [Casimicrobiaceae bacterium]
MKSISRSWHPLRFPGGLSFGAALLGIALLALPHAALADEYPDRPIHLLVPFVAGGPADIIGRLYATFLGELSGQSIVVENPAGASGVIGMEKAMRAKPDGYTLVLGSTTTMAGLNQIFMKNVPYDYDRDFTTIGLIANAPHVLAVRSSLPAKSFSEFVALVKGAPGKYTFSSAGPGTIVQMGGEIVKRYAGLDILHVPFKGGAPATMAVIAGTVDMTINDLTTLDTYIRKGDLRALAVANPTRLERLPDVPTFAELGLPKIVSSTWWGIAVPKGVPPEIGAELRAMHDKIIHDRDFIARLKSMSVEPLDLTPERTSAFIRSEGEKWKLVAASAHLPAQ